MKNIIYILFLFTINIQGQVGINTTTPKQIEITDIDLGENQSFTITYKVQLKDQYKDGGRCQGSWHFS